ncbi:BrnA antitoxin family protein [Methylorubrum populi]|uniref:BrnA antitoxin family protein n=1 Tax=Methylorubrum populi TaxID=223967 RepID=UPI0031F8BD64
MTEKSTRPRGKLVRFDSLDDMPPAPPLSSAFKALTDEAIEHRAADDPDAGAIPAEFWDTATPVEAETKEQITLRLDADVLRHFRSTGKGYQSRINAVLKSYVRAKEKAG